MADLSFWLGLVLAVPLSIAGNLVTPRIQDFLAKRSAEKSNKRIAELRKEFARIKEFSERPDKLHTDLLVNILAVIFLTSFIGAISLAFLWYGSMLNNSPLLYSAGRLVAISGAIVVAKICVDCLRDANRARNPEEYKKKLEAEIGSLD